MVANAAVAKQAMSREIDRTPRMFNIKETFGIQTQNTKAAIRGYATSNVFTPPVDEDYVMQLDIVRMLAAFVNQDKVLGLYLHGPHGAGKTSAALQFAARLNRAIRQMSINAQTDVQDLLGYHSVRSDGSMGYVLSPLVQGYREGHWVICNEVDKAQPGVLVALHGMLDGTQIEVPDPCSEHGTQLIDRHPEFRLFVTANTCGKGDDTGSYQGARIMDSAFLDRFVYLPVDYPAADDEIKIVKRWLKDLPDDVAEQYATKFVAVANDIRSMHKGTSDRVQDIFPEPMSIRVVRNWVTFFILFRNGAKAGQNPIDYALERSFTCRLSPADREAVHEIIHMHFADLPVNQ